jgi:hypothetical protein
LKRKDFLHERSTNKKLKPMQGNQADETNIAEDVTL